MLFEVITNTDRMIVRATEAQVRERMWAYIKERRAEGMSLAAIVFTWRRIDVRKLT